MHEEITKHTKKIYNETKNTKHSFGEKIKEIFIEIFIIVFAVTLSIWFHSWSEHRHQQKEVKEFLADLKIDLKDDIVNMETVRDDLSKTSANFSYLLSLTPQQLDSLHQVHATTNFQLRISAKSVINTGDYEGFKSSGKIGYIEHKKLKRAILHYYEKVAPVVVGLEKMNTDNVNKIYDFFAENADQGSVSKLILLPKFKIIGRTFIDQMSLSCKMYDQFIVSAKQIITEIDKQGSK